MKTQSNILAAITMTTTVFLSQSNALADNTPLAGVYFGIGLVQSDLASNRQGINARFNTSDTASIENSTTGLGLLVGYKMDEHLAFEFGYADMGDVIIDNGSSREKLFSTDSFSLSALLSYPLTSNINVYSRLGMSFWENYDNDDNTLESGDGLLYGVGADFNIYGQNNRLLRVEWQHQEFDDIVLTDADTLSASVVFQF